MITKTSLNLAFLRKVRIAARQAIADASSITLQQGLEAPQGQSYIANRRGRLMMRVDYQYGREPSLRFWAQSRRDITPMVQAALGGVL